MQRILSLFAILAVTWWLWSGYATAMLLGLGLFSCALVTWLSHRMHLTDHESIPLNRFHYIVLYWLWLIVDILRSNVDVAARILSGRLELTTRRLPATQHSDQSRVTYANSITLTPGTLSYDLETDAVSVHSLHGSLLDDLEKGSMARRVNSTERPA